MSSTPIIRQIAWISLIPQLALMALLIGIAYFFFPEYALMYGASAYLFISIILKTQISKAHRQGIVFIHKKQYKNAIIRFEESYAFFKKYPWVDKYRYITVLSASKIPFGEMALNNIAFSYGQLGNRKKARAYYKQTLAEYPNSEIAQVALNLLNAK